MTEIKIMRLSLENFKCHRHLELNFGGKDATIRGDNATGKTSVYDALLWLLFSKDSAGNGEKNMEVKPLDADGNVKDHDALTAVEAALEVNGEEIVLRRTYHEVWSTKRGSGEAIYDGNTSEYYIDGVPCKKNGFQDKVSQLVSEDTFRMLTAVSHFAEQISWQDRRAVLFQVAGVADDRQILAESEQFAPLAESLGRLSLEDYRKKLLSEKKRLVGAGTELPARISECQKTVEETAALDFAGARAEVERLNLQKNGLAAQVLAIEHDSAADAKRMEIREARLELAELENQNKAYRASQAAAGMDVQGLRDRLARAQAAAAGKKRAMENESAFIRDMEKRLEDARSRWVGVNGEMFTGTRCITCGQTLPADKLQQARAAFEANRQERLDSISQDANACKQVRQQAEERLAGTGDELARLNEEISDLQARITAAERQTVEIQDMDGYVDRREDINFRLYTLNIELSDMAESTIAVKSDLNRQIAQIQQEIDRQQEVISRESLLDYARNRVAGLREDARNAAACLEAIEKMLHLMERFSRYKTRYVEDSVNGLFRIARFRLFREQANGGVEERCDVVYEGVPYAALNNGAKINVGIDIINTLSRAYGVRVPLFIDNAESVTRLEEADTQVIRLVVSEQDKELRLV